MKTTDEISPSVSNTPELEFSGSQWMLELSGQSEFNWWLEMVLYDGPEEDHQVRVNLPLDDAIRLRDALDERIREGRKDWEA